MQSSLIAIPRQLDKAICRCAHIAVSQKRFRHRTSRPLRHPRDLVKQNEAYLRDLAEDNASRYDRTRDGDDDEFSMDMRDEAESSTSPWMTDLLQGQSQGREASPSPSDRRYTDSPRDLASQYTPPNPGSISNSLDPSWREPISETERTRVLRGVHSRQRRAQGATPAEASAMNELISQMLQTMPMPTGQNSHLGMPSARLGARDDVFFAPRYFSPVPPVTRRGRPSLRILDRLDSEEDAVVLEMLDGLKEEMGMCRTDVDLLKWAKEKVFAPSTASHTASSGSSVLADADDIGPSFSPVYPRILAHLLGYVRRNFNNPHLVLALFHYAQTQSPESYLSGCLAPAYNEVLKTRWESFRDLEGVEAGLREMEQNGIAWDRGTAKTIGRIVHDVGKEVWSGTGWQEKYGKDVHIRLAQLEDKLQKDINEQQRMYEAKLREKANMRLRASRLEERRQEYTEMAA